jgi:outer membrane usher protein
MLSPLFDAATVASIEKLPEVSGHVALTDLEAGGFLVKIEGSRLDITRRGAAASSTRAAKSEEAPIGSAGRLAPVVHNGDVLGEVQVRSSPSNQILLTKSALVDILTPVLEKDPSTFKRLVSLPDRDDQVALEALQTAGVQVRYTGGRVEFGSRGGETETPGYSKPVSSRLNPTGRTIVLNVPLIEETRLGEVLVRIEPDGRIIVPKASWCSSWGPFDQVALARLEKIPDKSGLVALGDLSGASFRLNYNPNQMELAFNPGIEQRPRRDLNYARSGLTGSSNLAQPAIFSGFVNISGGADYSWEAPNIVSLYLDLQSAIRVAGIVLESDFTYEGSLDPLHCPIGARCLYEHMAGLKRRYSRVVYDMPEQKIRMQFGDVEQQTTSFQRATDVLGVGIEKSARKLAPGERLSPTVGSAFSIERPSDVDVVINGAITQRLRLRPGNYSVRDLPLAAGANEIEPIIMDDRGQRRTVVLSTFADAKMLAMGKSEWAASGGLPAFWSTENVPIDRGII